VADVLWWLIIGAVFLVAEFGHRAFIALFIAVGAFAAAIAAVAGAGVVIQLPVFAVAAIASLVSLRPTVLRALSRNGPALISGIRAHIGHEAVVTERVGDITKPGRIKLDGELWKAISTDGKPIETGTVVMVLDLQGTTFVVEDLRTLGLNSMSLPEET
jgi:membrane protein implicated in regulation of membrane protease activity